MTVSYEIIAYLIERETFSRVIFRRVQVPSPGPYGEVSEWFKEPVLKTGDVAMHREFESHSLRQNSSVAQ